MKVTYPSFKIQLKWSEAFREIFQFRPFLPWASNGLCTYCPCQFIQLSPPLHWEYVEGKDPDIQPLSVEPATVLLHRRHSRNSW